MRRPARQQGRNVRHGPLEPSKTVAFALSFLNHKIRNEENREPGGKPREQAADLISARSSDCTTPRFVTHFPPRRSIMRVGNLLRSTRLK